MLGRHTSTEGTKASRGLMAAGLICSVIFIIFCVLGGIIAAAVDGLIVVLVGNTILGALHPHYYANSVHAIMIGALGFPVASAAIALAITGLRVCVCPCSKRMAAVLNSFYAIFAHTLSAFGAGVIGTAALRKAGVDLGEINAIRAGAAGALGSAIICPGVLALALLVAGCLGVSIVGLLAVERNETKTKAENYS